jgi:phthalate 4,5-dioxygenase
VLFVVPYDDTNTGWMLIYWDREKPVDREAIMRRNGLTQPGFYANEHFVATRENDNFHQDREAMANGSWSGLPGIIVEDAVLQLSQGAILDRSKECLVPSDVAIVRARRLLLESVDRVRHGQDPVGLAPRNSMLIRSAERRLSPNEPWHTMVPGHALVDAAATAVETVD